MVSLLQAGSSISVALWLEPWMIRHKKMHNIELAVCRFLKLRVRAIINFNIAIAGADVQQKELKNERR